jgi:hypothetical protein
MKYIKIAVLGFLALLGGSSTLQAASVEMNATAFFNSGILLTQKQQDLYFGTVNWLTLPGPGDLVSLGTDGSLVYTGGFSGTSTGSAGAVAITSGSDGQPVDIFCSTSAHLTNTTGQSIDAVRIKIAPKNATGSYATAGFLCQGPTGNPATTTFPLVFGTLDTVMLGAQLDGSTVAGGFTGGSYSTTNAGGRDVQVDVVYH